MKKSRGLVVPFFTKERKPLQPEVEREVVRMSKSGDSRSYEPLVRAYEGAGLRLAIGMLGGVDEATDALQDAFIKAWQSLHRFDITRPFGPWFFQILRNQCRDVIRSRQSRERHEVRDDLIEGETPSSAPGSGGCVTTIHRSSIGSATSTMPETVGAASQSKPATGAGVGGSGGGIGAGGLGTGGGGSSPPQAARTRTPPMIIAPRIVARKRSCIAPP